ncbi:hypothetical protein Trydic_g6957 [Trypoxylus dichotomus]
MFGCLQPPIESFYIDIMLIFLSLSHMKPKSIQVRAIDTVDILKLSEIISEFTCISCSKRVIQSVQLFQEYYITDKHLTGFLAAKPRCNFITTLNLNCIYWIAAADIRKCVSSLENLECLYLVDTKLGLLKPDIVLYNKLAKLKKLSISVTNRTFCKESLRYFPKVTHFYLHLDSGADAIIKHIVFVLRKQACVQEFWVIERVSLCLFPLSLLSHLTIPNCVEKFNSLLCNIYFCNEELSQMQRIHKSTFGRMIMCLEKRDRPVKSLQTLNLGKDWNTFFELSRTCDPFTPKQTKEIIDKESLHDINFDEIHFAHDQYVCGDTYKEVVGNLVLYDSMKSLKKLAISLCAGICEDHQEEIPSDRKRQKQDSVGTCLLEKISKNSPYIEELELWPCFRADGCSRISNESCNAIANFKYLRKLTIDNLPIHISGSFLSKVFLSCKYLTSLRIRSKQENSSLHHFLCLSLKYAIALKHLRYQHPCNISIDKLLLALSENRNLRIERLFIKCKSVEIFSTKPINAFLENNPDIRLFYIVIADLPKVVIKQTMKSLEKYNDDPRKIFLINQNEYSYTGKVQVPFIHTYEMVAPITHVAGLDVFNGYV